MPPGSAHPPTDSSCSSLLFWSRLHCLPDQRLDPVSGSEGVAVSPAPDKHHLLFTEWHLPLLHPSPRALQVTARVVSLQEPAQKRPFPPPPDPSTPQAHLHPAPHPGANHTQWSPQWFSMPRCALPPPGKDNSLANPTGVPSPLFPHFLLLQSWKGGYWLSVGNGMRHIYGQIWPMRYKAVSARAI